MATHRPDATALHVDGLLTQISIAYRNAFLIADDIFPAVMVDKQSDIVGKYDKSDWFRDQAGKWNHTEMHVGGYGVDTSDTYFCEAWDFGKDITATMRANADGAFAQLDRDAVNYVTDILMLRRERAFVTDFWKTGVWGTNVTGTSSFTKWSDYGGSDPFVDIKQTGRRTIRREVMRDPNTFVLGDLTRDVLLDHPDLVDRIKYTAPGFVDEALLARAVGVDRILVGASVYTADEPGTAEASVTYTANWDDDALLLYVTRAPSLLTPSAGYTFFWRPLTGGGKQYIRRVPDDKLMKETIHGITHFDQKALATGAGYFFSDAVD